MESKNQDKRAKQNKAKIIDTENRMVVAEDEGGWVKWVMSLRNTNFQLYMQKSWECEHKTIFLYAR